MKKTTLLLLFIIGMIYSASAQFHVELGMNFNSPQGDFKNTYKLGVGGYIEPKYAFNENIDLGLYLGSNGFVGSSVSVGNQSAKVGSTAVIPVLATGTYRFSSNKVTPYAGLGLGMYFTKVAQVQVSGSGLTTTDKKETKFGFAPRAGVYLGRLNLGMAYNLAGDVKFLQFNLGIRILGRG